MDQSGYRSTVEVEQYLAFKRPEIQDIVLELRSLVSSACPNAAERLQRRGLSYHDPAKGGPIKGAVCNFWLEPDRVLLGFVHGVRLSDPENLLAGDHRTMRYMYLDTFEAAPWEAIEQLIQEAAALDPSAFDPGIP